MGANDAGSKDVDRYIEAFPADAQAALRQIRLIVKKAAPDAQEKISYKIPAYVLNGKMLVYFAAFQRHIGLYPPIKGGPKLNRELAVYRGPKGNLKFPLDRPIPYALIRRLVKLRVSELTGQALGKRSKIAVENVNHPGSTRLVDATVYAATKRAYLKIIPARSPGLTLLEIQDQLIAELPDELFPNGAKAGWWAKTVQLDLEAKAVIVRERTKPLRLRKA